MLHACLAHPYSTLSNLPPLCAARRHERDACAQVQHVQAAEAGQPPGRSLIHYEHTSLLKSRINEQVEFLEAFLIQLVEREGQPVVAVEA